MTTATITEWRQIDEKTMVQELREAAERLNSSDGEVSLDFSAVRRLTSGTLGALEKLAYKAEEIAVKVRLRGVNVDVYKVLKLAGVTNRVTFVN
jgi:anti-anti-sigma regulatory factor